MDDFILTLHSYNVYLVILSGAITGIWGLIIFFRTKSIDPAANKPVSKEAAATASESETEAPSAAAVIPDSADGLVSAFRERTKAWRKILTVTIILSLLQGVFGIIMVLMGKRPGPPNFDLYYLHFVYGGIVALVIPIATTYATAGKKPRRDLLVYSVAALILTAAAVRAWMTGPAVFSLLP